MCPFHVLFLQGTATTGIYTLSLHDALPISLTTNVSYRQISPAWRRNCLFKSLRCLKSDTKYSASSCVRSIYREAYARRLEDRKSTRLNSSHVKLSYAVVCLQKKKASTTSNH